MIPETESSGMGGSICSECNKPIFKHSIDEFQLCDKLKKIKDNDGR